MSIEPHEPLQPGSLAPNFTLPIVQQPGTISLEDLRGRTVLLAMFRGVY